MTELTKAEVLALFDALEMAVVASGDVLLLQVSAPLGEVQFIEVLSCCAVNN